MTTSRDARESVEALGQGTAKARTARESVESLGQGSPKARTARGSVEALGQGTPKARTARESVEVLLHPVNVYNVSTADSVAGTTDTVSFDLLYAIRATADSTDPPGDTASIVGAYSRTGTDGVSGTDVPTSYVRAPRSGSESVPPPTDTATGTLQRLFVRFGVEILPAPADHVVRYTRLAVQAQPGGTLPTLRTIRPNEARAATSPIRVWSSDVPVSQPVPYDHAQPVLVDFGGFGFTTGGIAVNLADADLEAVYAPWYAPEAAP